MGATIADNVIASYFRHISHSFEKAIVPVDKTKFEKYRLPDMGIFNFFNRLLLCFLFILIVANVNSQTQTDYTVIGYFHGGASNVSKVRPKLITHIIYSFCVLRGNKLYLRDTLTVRRLVALKKQNPKLKVLLSLGGWGGCKSCSDLFTSAENREAFALSVKHANEKLGTDGIDLDWEYPAVEGYPGHKFVPEDKNTFTLLVQQLRKTLGSRYEISFAAGGFQEFLEKSIDWIPVMKEVDRVNIMTYDLVNGYSTNRTPYGAMLYALFKRIGR